MVLQTELPREASGIASISAAERDRLVRLCARISGSVEAAEDLAQETLLEAWRHEDKVYDLQGYSRWLSAIAHNVCLRWIQRRGRELGRLAPQASGANDSEMNAEYELADGFDLEVELEKKELADLLDRALALLPPDTGRLLVERYIRETPMAEIATRLSLSEGTLAVRLHRGKLALRRVLTTHLRTEAAAYGLCDEHTQQWQETRIWCPLCGKQRLVGRLVPGTGEFKLVCRKCTPEANDAVFQNDWGQMFDGIKGYKAALTRFMTNSHNYYRQGLKDRLAPCTGSGHLMSLRIMHMPQEVPPSMRDASGLHVRCEKCASISYITHRGLVRCLPEARRFWQEHPRIKSLPEREIDVGGRVALVIGFQSITTQARLDIVSLRDTFELVGIHQY